MACVGLMMRDIQATCFASPRDRRRLFMRYSTPRSILACVVSYFVPGEARPDSRNGCDDCIRRYY